MFTCKHEPAQQSVKEKYGVKVAWCIHCGKEIRQVKNDTTYELVWICNNIDCDCYYQLGR